MTKHIVWLLPAIVQAWQVQDVVPISSYDTAGSFLLLGCTNGSIYYIGYYYIILTHYFVCNLFIYCNQTSWTFRVIYWLEQFWTSSSAISFCDLWWHLHFIISESNFYLLDMMFHHFCLQTCRSSRCEWRTTICWWPNCTRIRLVKQSAVFPSIWHQNQVGFIFENSK